MHRKPQWFLWYAVAPVAASCTTMKLTLKLHEEGWRALISFGRKAGFLFHLVRFCSQAKRNENWEMVPPQVFILGGKQSRIERFLLVSRGEPFNELYGGNNEPVISEGTILPPSVSRSTLIPHTAPTIPGTSGCPLVRYENGEVVFVGTVSSIFTNAYI